MTSLRERIKRLSEKGWIFLNKKMELSLKLSVFIGIISTTSGKTNSYFHFFNQFYTYLYVLPWFFYSITGRRKLFIAFTSRPVASIHVTSRRTHRCHHPSHHWRHRLSHHWRNRPSHHWRNRPSHHLHCTSPHVTPTDVTARRTHWRPRTLHPLTSPPVAPLT